MCTQSVELDGSKSTGLRISYKWTLLDQGGVLSSNTLPKTSLSLQTPGTKAIAIRVLLAITDKYGITERDTVTVTFDAPPVADVSFPPVPNNDETLLVDGSVSTGKGLTYQWATTTGKLKGVTNKSTVVIQGLGLYTLKVTDSYGCTDTRSFNYPYPPHILMANADYVRTAWSDSVHIRVLNNDYDSEKDIDLSKITVVQKPQYGTTMVKGDGSIIYLPSAKQPVVDQFVYMVCDAANLCDTALVTVDIIESQVRIPEGISVNGDGHNETFVIRGLENYPGSMLAIYTRSGQLIYKSDDYQNDWGGTSLSSSLKDGTLLPTGTYYYILRLGGTNRYIKGFVYLSD